MDPQTRWLLVSLHTIQSRAISSIVPLAEELEEGTINASGNLSGARLELPRRVRWLIAAMLLGASIVRWIHDVSRSNRSIFKASRTSQDPMINSID
jgi:hypothetical protein